MAKKKPATAKVARPLSTAEQATLAALQARAGITTAPPTMTAPAPNPPPALAPQFFSAPASAPVVRASVDTSSIDGEIAAKQKALQTLNDQLSGKVAYCPPDILAIVHEVLGNEFTAVVRARTEAPLFELDITVPAQYSTMTADQKAMIKEDHRVVVIQNGDGLNAVRKYCELVRDEIKRSLTNQPITPPVVPITA